MKKIFTKATAFLSALTMSLCGGFGGFSASAEDSEPVQYKFTFNITEDMEPAPKVDVTLFNDKISDLSYINIPDGTFTKEGYQFSGWTVDGIEGFLPGDTYNITNGATEVVFEPVWYELVGGELHTVSYDLEHNGEVLEYPEWLKDVKALEGMIVTPNYTRINAEDGFSNGLILGGDYPLSFGMRFVMPANDVVLTPQWTKYITLTYYAGDVDRLVGNDKYTFNRNGNTTTDLAKNDRFSRIGFNLTGWLSDHDGQIYKPLEVVKLPDENITFTAVWEPKSYVVVFKSGNGGTNVKIKGVTDEIIICPEPDAADNGKRFAGWKDSEGKIYQPGDEYLIYGTIPGLGISLEGVWENSSSPVNTTTVTPAETTTSTQTTATTAEEIVYGDANCDGKVEIADATLILQFLTNKDEYQLTAHGMINADCSNVGDGVTAVDALAIQKLDAGVLKSLPEKN